MAISIHKVYTYIFALALGLILIRTGIGTVSMNIPADASEYDSVIYSYASVRGQPYSVGYDNRSILIDGKRILLFSGSIHYPRSSPKIWPKVFSLARQQGLNMITSYQFWNVHEPEEGSKFYGDNDDCRFAVCGKNISAFLLAARDAGLFVHWRLGPFIGAEWISKFDVFTIFLRNAKPNGGIPSWVIKKVSKIRSSDDEWMRYMKSYLDESLRVLEPFLARNGGPIILIQIENEFQGGDMEYTNFIERFVQEHDVGIPWTMCFDHDPLKGSSNGAIAKNTIGTVNSCNAGKFSVGSDDMISRIHLARPDMPLMWTENEMWFNQFGRAKLYRESTNVVQALGLWFARGAAHHNFYMWYGGSMFGNWSHPLGQAFGLWHTPAYADDACVHSDTIVNEPLFSRVAKLQHLLRSLSPVLLNVRPKVINNGSSVRCILYESSTTDNPDAAFSLAFVVNTGKNEKVVELPHVCIETQTILDEDKGDDKERNNRWELLMQPDSLIIVSYDLETPRQHECLYDTSFSIQQCSATYAERNLSRFELESNYELVLQPQFSTLWIDKQQRGWWMQANFSSSEVALKPNYGLLSLNVSGLPLGNIFVNDFHVATFSTGKGSCTKLAPAPCTKYIRDSCDRPTQDTYHIPPEVIKKENVLLIFMCQNHNGSLCEITNETNPPTWRHVRFVARHGIKWSATKHQFDTEVK